MKRTVTILGVLLLAAALMAGTHMPSKADDGGLGGEIIYTKPVKGVLFSHKSHVEELGLDCNMCHDKLFQMAARDAESKPDFTMKGLYAGKYCGACHAPNNMAFASNTQCARCHIGAKGLARAEQAGKKQAK